MLKLSSTDALARLSDKCRDLVRDLEPVENQLKSNTARLNKMRSDLIDDVHRAISELQEVDNARLGLLRENLGRFQLCEESLFDRLLQDTNAVYLQVFL